MSPVSKPRGFIVDSILPAHEIHLVYGPILEDCTLLTLHTLNEWVSDRPVFGHKARPVPLVYVACEATQASLEHAIRFMGIDHSAIPCVSLVGNTKQEDHNVPSALAIARRIVPKLQLLVLDGFLSLCPGRLNEYRDASRFMRETLHLCQRQGVTIIGIAPATKAKEGEGYVSLRERMHGSTAFMSGASAKIVIEPYRPGKILDPARIVTTLPRIAHPKLFSYSRISGPLTYLGEGVTNYDLNSWLTNQHPGTEVSALDLRTLAAQLGIPTSTLYNWIADQIELGTLVKTKHGIYTIAERLAS